jgi:hypothetical protein
MPGSKPGERRGGRKKGTPNKATAALKDAILLAAADVGEDGDGKDGLQGYLRQIARNDFKAYSSLLGRVLPMQITGEGGGPLKIVISPDDGKL